MVRKSSLKIIWDQQALIEFKDILTHLSTQSQQAPKIVKVAILNRLKLLKSNPLMYEADKLKHPVNTEYRAFVVFSFRVTYQIKSDKNEIRILRIRHIGREPLGY
jgi:plasmid stabilization system protein ParE